MLIKDICIINPKSTINHYDFINYIDTSSVIDGTLLETQYLINNYPSRAKRQLKINDILISSVRPNLKHNYYVHCNHENLIGSTGFIQLRVNNENIHPKYLYYFLTSNSCISKYINVAETSQTTFPSFNKDVIENIVFPNISFNEQFHIVNIIGSIDNLIESNTVALNSIESLINNIFHAHYILWKEKKELGKVFTCILGGTPSTKNVEYWDGNIPWINSGEVNNLRISTPTKYITKLGLEKSATKLLPTGTTVIAITGATLGQVSLLEIDSCANQSVIGILENKEYKRDYIYPLMNKIIKELILNQTGGAQQHINKNDVQSFIINIPNIQQYEEYTKIVLPLLNHQSMIVKQNNKLTNLKQKYLNKFFD